MSSFDTPMTQRIAALEDRLSRLSEIVGDLKATEQFISGAADPSGVVNAVQGTIYVRTGAVPQLYYNTSLVGAPPEGTTWNNFAGGGGAPPLPHNLLSASHGDTVANGPTRGSLIYGNVTLAWDELVLGGIAGSVLTRDAADVLWSNGALSFAGAFTLTVPATGTAVLGGGSGASPRVAIWNDANTLTSDAGLTVDAGNNLYIVADGGGIANAIGTARVILDSSGAQDFIELMGAYVGINDATPSYHLDVNGMIGINGIQTIYNAGAITLNFTNTLYLGNGGGSLLFTGGLDGSYITAVGYNALLANTTGYRNTAVGNGALNALTTGYHNTATGAAAGTGATTNTDCTYIGYNADTGADGSISETVIGAGVTGNGSNTITIGAGIGMIATYLGGNLIVEEDKYVGRLADVRIVFDATGGFMDATFGDNAGADKFRWIDSGAAIVGYVDSNGAVMSDALTASTVIYSNASKVITSLANAAGYLTNNGAGVLSWSASTTPSAHNLLSASHGDTVANGPTRGSLIYGNATPAWDELVLGGIVGSVLTRNATDVLWSAGALSFGGAYTLTIPATGTALLRTANVAAGRVLFGSDANTADASANLYWTSAGNRVTIGTPAGVISDFYTQLLIAGTTPGINQEVQRPSGGAAVAFSRLSAKKNGVSNEALWGEMGYYGSFGGAGVPADPTPNYIYIGVGSTAAYNDNAFRIYPTTNNVYVRGSLGVATTSPSAKIHVAGDADIQQALVVGHTTQATTTPMAQITRNDTAAGVSAMLGLTALGSGANGDGGAIYLRGKSSTTAAQDMARIEWLWTTATHATRASDLVFSVVNSASLVERLRISAAAPQLKVVYDANNILNIYTAQLGGTYQFSQLYNSTSDGADNGVLALAAGGSVSGGRGGHIIMYGNEYAITAALAGEVIVQAGNVSTGDVSFYTGGAQKAQLNYTGDFLIGTSTAPGATNGKTLMFGDNGGNPTPGSNTAGIFAKDVGGTVEMFAIDEAGNANQLTPHNYAGPVQPLDGVLHWSQYHRNEYAGVEKWYDIERALLALEQLSGQKFIHTRRIIKRPKPAKHPEWLRSFK